MDQNTRALEHAAIAGDDLSARKLVEARRREGFDSALQGWVERLRGALTAHLRATATILYEDAAYRERELAIKLDVGPKYVRVWKGSSAYAFIEKATGNILKPGGWKAPEPKKIIRGNIYAENPLDGCGPYGVIYANGGGSGGFPIEVQGIAVADAAPIVQAPAPKSPDYVPAEIKPGTTVRQRDTFGPCIEIGLALEDQRDAFKYKDKDTGRVKLAKKVVQPKYAGAAPKNAHIEPCRSCQDHPDTRFKPGNCSIHGCSQPCETCQSM